MCSRILLFRRSCRVLTLWHLIQISVPEGSRHTRRRLLPSSSGPCNKNAAETKVSATRWPLRPFGSTKAQLPITSTCCGKTALFLHSYACTGWHSRDLFSCHSPPLCLEMRSLPLKMPQGNFSSAGGWHTGCKPRVGALYVNFPYGIPAARSRELVVCMFLVFSCVCWQFDVDRTGIKKGCKMFVSLKYSLFWGAQ